MKRVYWITMVTAILVMFLPLSASANLLLSNPDFETGDLTGWTPGDSGEVEVQGTEVYEGSYSLRLRPNKLVYQDFSADAETIYYLSAAWKTVSNYTWGDLQINVEWYDAVGSIIGAKIENKIETVPITAWTPYTFEVTSPADTATGRFILGAYGPGENAYVDNAYADSTPIPEPGSLFLLGTGLLGILYFTKRTKI